MEFEGIAEGRWNMLNQRSSSPYLSIVVPVYNVEQYLEKCVYSILRQSFINFEVILIDDGSTDKSGFLCDEYAQKDKRIRIVHQNNAGVSAARNTGIELAIGKYITFVDSDDWIEADTYELALNFLHLNHLEVVCFDFYKEKRRRSYYRPMYNADKIFQGNEAVNEVLKEVLDSSVWDKVYLRRLFNDVRYPIGRVFEDVATTYKVLTKANKTGYLKKPLYHYVKRENSIIGTSFSVRKRWDRFLFQQERLHLAEIKYLESLELCRVYSVRQALSVITANYVEGTLEKEKVKEIVTFISIHGTQLKPKLTGLKTKFLLISNNNSPLIHKIYAYLSYYVKKHVK